jgi:hypothetical protein
MGNPNLIRTRFFTWLVALTLTGSFAGTVAPAEPIEVDVQLVLAADVSGSMPPEELRIQREGYVSAFRHSEVIRAILSGSLGKVAVTYVEWAGCYTQSVIVPWMVLSDPESIELFARRLSATPTGRSGPRTAVSCALLFAATQFPLSGVRSHRMTIDISGNGKGNDGPLETLVRELLVRQGMTINALSFEPPYHYAPSPDVHGYYRDKVVGGPGAFAVAVDNLNDFAAAIRRKLIIEIAWRQSPSKHKTGWLISPPPGASPATTDFKAMSGLGRQPRW